MKKIVHIEMIADIEIETPTLADLMKILESYYPPNTFRVSMISPHEHVRASTLCGSMNMSFVDGGDVIRHEVLDKPITFSQDWEQKWKLHNSECNDNH